MEKPKNVWLQVNSGKINSLMQKMEEERFKSAYPDQVDLRTVILMFKGMINEIETLQKENDVLKQKPKEVA